MRFQIDKLHCKSKDERQLEKMIRKTGREIHRLRKAKLGFGELDKHMFAEKMAFLTTSKFEVPPMLFSDPDSGSSRSSTLKYNANDLSGLEDSSSSTCSTPTPHFKASSSASSSPERFSYDIDPDIGVIV